MPVKKMRCCNLLPLCPFCEKVLRLPKTFPNRYYCADPRKPFLIGRPVFHCDRFVKAPDSIIRFRSIKIPMGEGVTFRWT